MQATVQAIMPLTRVRHRTCHAGHGHATHLTACHAAGHPTAHATCRASQLAGRTKTTSLQE